MDSPRRAVTEHLVSYIKGLRFPWLLGITLVLFLLDLVIPDFIPFADEILLGLVAAVLATLKRKRAQDAPSEAPLTSPAESPD